MAAVTVHSNFGAQENKICHCLHFFPIYLPWNDESKRGEWKSWLKLNIKKTKIMASGPITSWQIDGETVETMTVFIFLGSSDGLHHHCRWWLHEIKRQLLLVRKVMTNLDSILKSRDITLPTRSLPTKVRAMIFPLVMSGCESWTIKKAEH